MRPSLGGEAGHYSRKLLYPHTTRFKAASFVGSFAISLLFFLKSILLSTRSDSDIP